MKQGEIWLVSLDPTIGAEIKKTRPAIIVNDNNLGRLPLKIIVPVTDWKDRYAVAPWMVKLTPDPQNKLAKESSADCFQVRSVAEERCVKKLGQVDSRTMDKIRKGLAVVLSIE
ncbi:type II toxin-antitoxin system PemK/MazF family toxin [Hymenobacter gummosus]|uniref:mRNA interferase n=1 Tax=Hymenobacter gummosus TaxID=1776032 RepID=A0A3S0HQ02_9BACT|nr:type II toxin-antitoxin system PemK/MazF family toxin [Hymenobacter gummosus]RTQ51636.1 type II toxin-antitoxin system PemK/MazF family toxin [Hymenobacter gummosus]